MSVYLSPRASGGRCKGAQLRTRSREYISARAGYRHGLAIDPRYLINPLDFEVMARHIQFIEEHLTTTEPLASYLMAGGKRVEGAPGPGKLASLEAAKE